jgi:hypothetical protein
MTGIPTYVSWDPGGSSTKRTTGIAYWDEQANFIEMRSLTEKEFDEEIGKIPSTIKEFIIEQYKPHGHINHTGNKLTTAQRIGDIKGYARRHQIKVTEQPSTILQIAAMWAQYKIPRNHKGQKQHIPDYISAYLHGYYYLFRKGLIKAKVLDS